MSEPCRKLSRIASPRKRRERYKGLRQGVREVVTYMVRADSGATVGDEVPGATGGC